ncbi:TcmI family type II polyketide cyclase [Nonomuraea sp. NPDC050404]|uniref:TcmI family type II polyketide cyclase n=1 Tax=Nonomuraea sp. NPDC050404 TaxID=3155783 RepID=UPI0033C4626C
MHQTLIVARMSPRDKDAVAEIWHESDATELPHRVGVDRRVVFSFHDLYFHLVVSRQGITENLYKARPSALYQDINRKLAQFIRPYDPGWKEPKDSMAEPFYVWDAQR